VGPSEIEVSVEEGEAGERPWTVRIGVRVDKLRISYQDNAVRSCCCGLEGSRSIRSGPDHNRAVLTQCSQRFHWQACRLFLNTMRSPHQMVHSHVKIRAFLMLKSRATGLAPDLCLSNFNLRARNVVEAMTDFRRSHALSRNHS
jgi:hypothetical protein